MLPNYADIRSRIAEEPRWFDERGVPRYEPFTPEMLGVYDSEAALIEISCQNCGQRFLVGIGFSKMEIFSREGRYTRPTTGDIGSYHYGDPPIHGCNGDTMNVISLRIVEFWAHHEDGVVDGVVKDYHAYFDWKRLPAHEVVIETDDAPR